MYEKIIAYLKSFAGENGQVKLVEATGMSQSQISKFLRGQNIGIKSAAKILDLLGAEITFPEERTETVKNVCFIAPKKISSMPGVEGPIEDNYLAVPLASMPVAAGAGIIPEEKIRSWILVWTGQEAIRHRTNLAAIEIGKGQFSMEPTLHPGDLVLIDRNDTIPQDPPGNIYLVQSPDDDGLAIKRVRLQRKNGQELVVFFSDNMDYLPEIFDLDVDYDGDLKRAIKGRVIWSWSDMTRK